jgi:hypothetical protein
VSTAKPMDSAERMACYRARAGQVKYAGWKRRAGIEEG